MIKNIIEAIRKDEKFSFEKIIENNIMTDDEYFEFLKFVYIEGVPEVRTSIDSTDLLAFDNEDFYMEEKEMIRAYLEDVKEKYELDDSNNSTLVEKNLKVAIKESINYSKFGFSFLDIVQEATLGVISALNYSKRINDLNLEEGYFLKNFAIKYILEYQKKLLRDVKASELSFVLYLKIQMEKDQGRSVDEICKQMGIDKDYMGQLEELFDGYDPEEAISSEELMEKANSITQAYILENIPKKLNYIDEQILVLYYGLDEKVYKENEIAKMLNISLYNVNILREKALNKLSIDLVKKDFGTEMYSQNYIN
ncbi:MAG: RNA polymerase subunit sigma [Leptotrichiaceae bacterium]